MVKIEQLKDAKAVFTRNNVEQPVFLGSMLTKDEFKTLKVLNGTIVVSIDEEEVLTISAKETPVSKTIVVEDIVVSLPETITLEIKSPEPIELTVETPVAITPKKVVQPKSRTAK